MIHVEITGSIMGFEETTTQSGDKLQCIHVKTGPNTARKIWFNVNNLFFDKFGTHSEGKRFWMKVTEEATDKGGIKTRLVECKEIKEEKEPEAKDPNEPPF